MGRGKTGGRGRTSSLTRPTPDSHVSNPRYIPDQIKTQPRSVHSLTELPVLLRVRVGDTGGSGRIP